MAVETRAQSVVVRGALRTVTVPRAAIREVTDYPAIVWTKADGNRRWTPVTAFVTPASALGPVRGHHRECVSRLRKWAQKRA